MRNDIAAFRATQTGREGVAFDILHERLGKDVPLYLIYEKLRGVSCSAVDVEASYRDHQQYCSTVFTRLNRRMRRAGILFVVRVGTARRSYRMMKRESP